MTGDGQEPRQEEHWSKSSTRRKNTRLNKGRPQWRNQNNVPLGKIDIIAEGFVDGAMAISMSGWKVYARYMEVFSIEWLPKKA